MLYKPYPFKRCTKCGKEYPETTEYFATDKRRYDSLRRSCRECGREYSKKWNRDHPERIKENSSRWNQAHPEQFRARQAKRYHNNREREKARKAQWSKNNREREYQRQKEYAQNNKELYRISASRRRARKLSLSATFTAADWDRCLAYFDYRCAVCGRPRGLWHILAQDHWIPLSSPECPGTIATNIIPLCHGEEGCNNSKHSRDPHEWLVAKFGQRKANQIEERIRQYQEWIAH